MSFIFIVMKRWTPKDVVAVKGLMYQINVFYSNQLQFFTNSVVLALNLDENNTGKYS
jgi:hypothetical protein